MRNPFKRKGNVEAEVRVATWNVNHGTSKAELWADLKRVERDGAEVLLLQEFKPQKGHAEVLRKAGWELRWISPEFAVAWRPERFEFIREHEWEGEHDYWAEPKALTVTLLDKDGDGAIRLSTVHPPAHVQRKDHGKWPNIWKALDETDEMWDRKARRSNRDGIPYICGGDENVDLKRGWFPEFFRRLITGAARPIDPNEPTHHRRTIDRFRINRYVRVVPGTKNVIKGLASDHNAFICTFRITWK